MDECDDCGHAPNEDVPCDCPCHAAYMHEMVQKAPEAFERD